MKKRSKKLIGLFIVLITIFQTQFVFAASTSTTSRISDFKSSAAYKNFTSFSSKLNLTYTNPIPGLINTNVNGSDCSSMVPQGICFAGNYLLVSAYDSNKQYNSVIYVVSNTDPANRKYLTTLVLPNKSHAGGITYDGYNIWVSSDSKVGAFKYDKIRVVLASGARSSSISYISTPPVKTQSSFMTYYDGRLWVGNFNETSTGMLYGYKINSVSGSNPTLATSDRNFEVPDRTQGVSFRDGKMILSRSYERSDELFDNYISEIRCYKPSWSSPTSTGLIYKNNAVSTLTLPPMVEGVFMASTYTYLLFESGAKEYYSTCPYPVDRICALNISSLFP
jgi:hypothetical protein